MESLIRCGAFDSLGALRSQLMAVYEKTLDSISQDRKRNVAGQVSLFAELGSESPRAYKTDSLPDIEEYPKKILLSMEKEMTGVYISGHPLDEYKEALEEYHTTQDIMALHNTDEQEMLSGSYDSNLKEDSIITLGGIITNKKIQYTRNNSVMAFITLEDLYGDIEVIVFPLVYSKYASLLDEDRTVAIKGRISLREDEEPKIICNEVQDLTNNVKSKLYIKIESDKDPKIQDEVSEVLKKYKAIFPFIFIWNHPKTYKSNPDLWVRRDSGLCRN